MANYQKLQVSTALNIVPSDDANIPYPNVVVSGTSAESALNELEDDSVDFIALNVQVGDIVYNVDTQTTATVIQVSGTILFLNANLFSTADSYIVYTNNNRKESCVLYIGTGGDLTVTTGGGQDVIFRNILGGTFLPVQVLKVFASGTGASDIVALW
jgi:hypothetical protein